MTEKEKELLASWKDIPRFNHILADGEFLEQEPELESTLFKVISPTLKKQIYVLRQKQSEEEFIGEFGKKIIF